MNRLVVLVVAGNFALALGGLYLARRLRHWRQTWATLADNLVIWERDLQETLALTAELDVSRQKLLDLRQRYTLLRQWIGYLPYLRQGLRLIVGLGMKRRNRVRQRVR